MGLIDKFHIGQIIGDFTINGFHRGNYSTLYLDCTCNICGKVKSIRADAIPKKPGSISHEYCIDKYPNKVGDIIEDMRIVNIYRDNKRCLYYECECTICGRYKKIEAYSISRLPGVMSHSHCRGLGVEHPELYATWSHMKQRIYNPNDPRYPRYGGRGITTDYDKFEDFYNDLHESYYQHVAEYGVHNTTLDRKDNNGNYTKDNLRWATRQEQARNTSNIKLFYAFDLQTGIIYLSNNMTQFALNHNMQQTGITACIHGRLQTSAGFMFKLADDPQLLLFTPQNVIEEFYY